MSDRWFIDGKKVNVRCWSANQLRLQYRWNFLAVVFPILIHLRTKRWFDCVRSVIVWTYCLIMCFIQRLFIDFWIRIVISLLLVESKLWCLDMFHVKVNKIARTWKDETRFIKFLKKRWFWWDANIANIIYGSVQRPSEQRDGRWNGSEVIVSRGYEYVFPTSKHRTFLEVINQASGSLSIKRSEVWVFVVHEFFQH